MLRRIRKKYLQTQCQRFLSCSKILKTENIYDVENGPVEANVPPRHAKVVVCGGGVMGASVVYHLAKLGWGKDTILIEQNR